MIMFGEMKMIGEDARNNGLDRVCSVCSTEKQDQKCVYLNLNHKYYHVYCYIQAYWLRYSCTANRRCHNRLYAAYRKMFQLNIIIDFNEFPLLFHI